MTALLIIMYLCVTVCWGVFVMACVCGESDMRLWEYMLIPLIIVLWPVLAVFGALFVFFTSTESLMKWSLNKCKKP